MKIPIQNVEAFAVVNGLTQLVVFGYDGSESHIATWAADVSASDTLADAANSLKAALRWPEITQVESAKVLELRAEIARLKAELDTSKNSSVHKVAYVLECTEYERGWGQRPDGYLAFQKAADLKAFLVEDQKTKAAGKETPYCYITYTDIGIKSCSTTFFNSIGQRRYFDQLSELKVK